jgi:hypothetical protein
VTSRLLPQHEWPRLRGTLLDPAWQDFAPTDTVLVVEDGGEIVGCIALFQRWHLEGAWKAEDRRGDVAVGRALVKGIREMCADVGATEVACMAVTPEGRRLCEGIGQAVKLDCEHFAVRMES